MNITVTGGLISVEDCKKHDGYPDPQFAPTRKIRIEIGYSLPADTAAQAGAVAIAALGRIISAQVDALLARSPETAKVEVVQQPTAPVEEPKKRGPRTAKAQTDKDKLAVAAGVQKAPEQIDLEELTSVAPEKPAETDPDDLMTIAPATEITDAALSDAVQDKNRTLNNPVKIRALIGSYNPDPAKAFTLREIKQENRPEFLEKLKALTA